MTKEELIALSDLNREDNIKYISSEAQGIAIALDSDRYSPTLCKLERAYICGRRKSEEQIAELEESNKEWQRACGVKSDTNSQLIEQLADKVEKIAELEAQIEKMKCCENCKHHYIALDDTTSCKLLDRLASSKPCDKWEIKEK